MRLEIQAETMAEMKVKVLDVAKAFGIDTHSVQTELPLATAATPITDTAGVTELAEASAKKRGRPKKVGNGTTEDAPSASETHIQSTAPTPSEKKSEPVAQAVVDTKIGTDIGSPAPTPPATRDQVLVALGAVNSKKGTKEAMAVLAKFGAAKVSELKADKYGEFCAACEGALK